MLGSKNLHGQIEQNPVMMIQPFLHALNTSMFEQAYGSLIWLADVKLNVSLNIIFDVYRCRFSHYMISLAKLETCEVLMITIFSKNSLKKFSIQFVI